MPKSTVENNPCRLVFVDFLNGRPVPSTESIVGFENLDESINEQLLKFPLLFSSARNTSEAAQPETSNSLNARKLLSEADVIVIGRRFDPFSQIDNNLFAAITFLDNLAPTEICKVVVRSRSPYLILATPALRVINAVQKGRASVSFGLEASTAHHAKIVSRSSASPAERIETIKALRANGVQVIAQYAPFLGGAQTIDSSVAFCKELSQAVNSIGLLEFDRLIEAPVDLQRPPESNSAQSFASARPGRHTRSFIIASQILAISAADRVFTLPAEPAAKSDNLDSSETAGIAA